MEVGKIEHWYSWREEGVQGGSNERKKTNTHPLKFFGSSVPF
jgi:hypothetical protein